MSRLQEARQRENELQIQLREISKQRLELERAEDAAYRDQFDKVLMDALRRENGNRLLNLLAPDHELLSCSDKKPCNATRYDSTDCVRCSLLNWMDHPEMIHTSFRVEFRLNVIRREDPDER